MAAEGKSDKELKAGHRARLREKILSRGAGTLSDYEILEYLLSAFIPQKDLNPAAKRLLARFGDFAGVVHATPLELRGVAGIGETAAAAIKIVEAAMVETLRAKLKSRPVVANWQDLLDYLRVSIGGVATEEFHVLYLDSKCRLIADEIQSRGTINQSQVYPREVVRRALGLEAAGAIIVHNHPTGDTAPSSADIEITKKVYQALRAIDVPLHDHVVVSAAETTSFKRLGLL